MSNWYWDWTGPHRVIRVPYGKTMVPRSVQREGRRAVQEYLDIYRASAKKYGLNLKGKDWYEFE